MVPRKSCKTVSLLSQLFESEDRPSTSSTILGGLSTGANSGRPNVQVTSTGKEREDRKIAGPVRVTYSAVLKRVTLERYLVSRIIHQIGEVSFSDILVLYDNLLWCEEKSRKDPGFQKKFGADLLILAKILKETRFSSQNFPHTVRILSLKLKENLEDFAFPKRNVSGIAIHVRGKFHILPSRESGVPRDQVPHKPYIGVGYKDKGNRRDPAIDASPSWQEVVNSRIFPWQD